MDRKYLFTPSGAIAISLSSVNFPTKLELDKGSLKILILSKANPSPVPKSNDSNFNLNLTESFPPRPRSGCLEVVQLSKPLLL